MSIRLMSRVWDSGSYDQTALLVLLALADQANDDGVCWPAVSTLAARARCSDRHVRRLLLVFESDGWLSIEHRAGASSRYTLTPVTPDTQVTPDTPVTPDTQVTPPLTPRSATPDTQVTQTIRTINEPPSSSSEAASGPRRPRIDDDPRPEVIDLCEHLAAKARANGHDANPGKLWHRACRLMIDTDGHTPEQIRKAIDWATSDPFWSTNIRSMPTLREKYSTLRAQAAGGQRRGSPKVETIVSKSGTKRERTW